MKTRIFSISILSAAAVVAMTACGGGNAQPAPAAPAPEPAAIETPAPAPVAPPVPMVVSKQWDFTVGEDALTGWRVVAADSAPEADGVHFIMNERSGPVVAINTVRLPAEDYAGVRVRATVNDEALPRVRFFWARSTDVAAADGGWVYAEERSVMLSQPDPDDAGMWEARLDTHSRWNGRIDAFFVEVQVPRACVDTLDECPVILSEISLLSVE